MLRKIFQNVSKQTMRYARIPASNIQTSCIGAKKTAVAVVKDTNENGLKLPNYTEEESNKILNCIKNKKVQELLSYDISKARAAKLYAWQERNGSLKQLQDILMVDGFSMKMVEKFYNSILGKGDVIAAAKKSRNAAFVLPSVDVVQQQSIRSCVSIRINVSSVSWARLALPTDPELNAPCELTHWRHHEILEKKMHLNDLVQRCLYIVHLIPEADCYLFENPQMAQLSTNPGNVDQQNINVQKSQIIAMLSYALRARVREAATVQDEDTDKQSTDQSMKSTSGVYYLRRFLTARLFSHLVGTERVSSEQTILQLMRTYYNKAEQTDYLHESDESKANTAELDERLSIRGNVQFRQELREMFAHAERYQREFLGQALLLNLTFVRLVLLQDAKSIAKVSPNTIKDKALETI